MSNAKKAATTTEAPLVSTGVAGLDDVLGGGLTPNRLYLLEGTPGSGKTTLALQFLRAGAAAGETVLFVALSESLAELHASATSHGWTLDGIEIFQLMVNENAAATERYTMFHPSEVELGETMKAVLAEAERVRPTRLVFDSLSELRLLAENPLRYRRQILALKQHFSKQQCTVILVDDRTGEQRDMQLHSLAHGVISLERKESDYGALRRRVQVSKMRGRAFREGYHDFTIQHGGVAVFPRLVAAEHHVSYPREAIHSGVAELDTLLGGGLSRGTSTLILGPSGSGKTSIATQFATHSARAGKRASMFLFEEGMHTFTERSSGLGMDIAPHLKLGTLTLRQVDPAELSPGEFTDIVRREVEENGAEMVIIDSLNGYLNAMPNERFLMLHLHELLTYLGQHGVTTILLMTQHGIVSGDVQVPIDASYLADTVMLLRYFEAVGEVRQAVSVIKKRTGAHEHNIRELRLDGGLRVGEPVKGLQGVLTGNPQVLIGEKGA
jgi:circadian clock protein KaiC